jgi:Tol biopolymer transport system component
VPLTSYPGSEASPSFSPDGNQIAFSWNGEKRDNYDIYVKLIGPGEPLRLTTNPADDSSPAWSPDGRTIAFLRDFGAGKFGVYLIPALGGPERKVLDIFLPENGSGWLAGPYLAWLPDSKGIIFSHKDSPQHPANLFLLRVDNYERRQLTVAPAGSFGDSEPALSPDGSTLLFTRSTGIGPSDLYLEALSSGFTPAGEPKRISFDNTGINGAAWTSSGQEIVFSSDRGGDSRLWNITLPRLGRTPGKPERLEPIGADGASPAISRQGRRLAYVTGSGGDWDIWRVAIPDWSKGGKSSIAPARFAFTTRGEFAPQYSPDGKRVAFESDRRGSLEIWVCQSDGSGCVQLTSFGGPLTGLPHWSPDGQRIAFYSRTEGKAQIYAIDAEGGVPRRLTNDLSDNMFSNWSRDGRWIYFASNRSGVDQVWKMPSSGGTAVQVTKNGAWAMAESPDGRYLYYTRSKDPNAGLWRMPVEGGPESRVSESIVMHNFAVTNRGIYLMTQPDLHAGRKLIQFLSFADQKPRLIAATDRDVYHGCSVSPDEHWLLYTQSEPASSNLMLVENFR